MTRSHSAYFVAPSFMEAPTVGVGVGRRELTREQEDVLNSFDYFPPVMRICRAAGEWWRAERGVLWARGGPLAGTISSVVVFAQDLQTARPPVAPLLSDFMEAREELAAKFEKLVALLPAMTPETPRPPQDFLDVANLLRAYEAPEAGLAVQRHFDGLVTALEAMHWKERLHYEEALLRTAPLSRERDEVFRVGTAAAALTYLHRCDEIMTQLELLEDMRPSETLLTTAAALTTELHGHVLLLEASEGHGW